MVAVTPAGAFALAQSPHFCSRLAPVCLPSLLQASAELRQLMQAAQVGREDEVLRLLQPLVASLGSCSTDSAASGVLHAREAAGGRAEHAVGDSGGGAPGSADRCDRGASSSMPDADGEQPEQAHSSASIMVCSAAGFAAVDVRRWMFEYSAFRKLRRLGTGSFGEASMLWNR